MKQKLLLTIIMLLGVVGLNAQELISAGGDSFVGSNYSIDWSIGEVSSSTYTSDDYILNEGFIQGYTTTVQALDTKDDFGISFYPNPAKDILNIQSSGINDFNVKILDLAGNIILNDNISGNQTQVDLMSFPAGVYILTISQDNQNQSFKIIKK